MPKSKKKWKHLEGRVGPAWDKDVEALLRSHRIIQARKGFKFHRIEWFGERFVLYFVSER